MDVDTFFAGASPEATPADPRPGLRPPTDKKPKAGDGVALKSAPHPDANKKAKLTNAKDKKAKQPTAKKSARAVTKATKPKKARPPKRPNKPVKVITKKAPAKKTAKPAKVAAPGPVRSERMDLRLSKKEKALIQAKAKKLRRTLTSLFVEFVEKIK